MWRYAVGGIAALLLVAAGIFLFKSRAGADRPLPTAPAAMAGDAQDLPDTVPEATKRSREQKRFDRYDKDRNASITREEFLTPRRKAYAKLDVNHDGVLSFDEWSVRAITRFTEADKDKSGAMNAAEFATTAQKRTARPRCACAQATAPAKDEDD
ncbi:hypothetical protein BH09PSE4_BH09PSE4_07790 [soil metagenome]